MRRGRLGRLGRLGARRVAALALVVLLPVVWWLPSSPAAGAAPERQGWWKAPGPLAGLGLGGLDALGGPETADVPDEGLLVAGSPTGGAPQAVAAVAYPLGERQLAGPLRLVPDPAAASVPGSAAMACPLDVPDFVPAQGGPIAEAPAHDCFGGVVATVDDEGAYLFDVATVVRGGWVAVAIVPVAATDRIVFSAPGDDALPLSDVPAPSDGGGDVTTGVNGGSGVGEVPSSTPRPGLSGGGSASFDVGAYTAPGPAAPSAGVATTSAAAASQTSSTTIQPALAASGSSPSGRGRALLLVGVAALAGLLWVGAGSDFAGEPA